MREFPEVGWKQVNRSDHIAKLGVRAGSGMLKEFLLNTLCFLSEGKGSIYTEDIILKVQLRWRSEKILWLAPPRSIAIVFLYSSYIGVKTDGRLIHFGAVY